MGRLVMSSHGVADYLRALRQLLPKGFAWQWSTQTIASRYLAIIAAELHRLHVLLESIPAYNIQRWEMNYQGWKASDYERILLEKFNVSAKVTDGIPVFSCESHCESPLLEDRISYVYVVTVEDISALPVEMFLYLQQYQQAHTHYHFRERLTRADNSLIVDSLHLGVEIIRDQFTQVIDGMHCETPLYETPFYQNGSLAVDSLRLGVEIIGDQFTQVIDGMHCETPLYETPFYQGLIEADWSYSDSERNQLINQ